jgi:hypothetical protein
MTEYTLARRKQGGSQSTNDSAKGNAKSAGAQLRRYGEQSLREVQFFILSLDSAHIIISLGYSRFAPRMGR